MKRTFAAALATALLTVATLGTTQAAPPANAAPRYALSPKGGEFFGFNADVAPWTAGAHNPKYLSEDTLTHQLQEDPTSLTSLDGYAALLNTGDQAVWMQTTIKSGGEAMKVSFEAMDANGCGRCAVVAFVGNESPSSLYEFQKVGNLLKSNRQQYSVEATVKGTVIVAIGIMNLDGTDEKQMASIDNIRIQAFSQ